MNSHLTLSPRLASCSARPLLARKNLTTTLFYLLLFLLLASLHVAKAQDASAYSATTPAVIQATSSPEVSPVQGVDTHEPVLSDELFGCIAVGTTATAIGAAAGSVNLINLIGGGIVLPSNPVILVTGLIGVVWLSFCEIGEKLTPLGVYAYEQYSDWTHSLATEAPGLFGLLAADQQAPLSPIDSDHR